MQIIKNEQVFYVGWRYENPNLKRILDAFDLSDERVTEITEAKIPDENRPGKERRAGIPALIEVFEGVTRLEVDTERRKEFNKILDRIKAKGFPRATITKCILCDADKKVVNYAVVKKFPLDPHDREKARKESFGKLLRDEFPGSTLNGVVHPNKTIRTEFWNQYFSIKEKVSKPTNGVMHNPQDFLDKQPKAFAMH